MLLPQFDAIIGVVKPVAYHDLPPSHQALLDAAKQAMQHAYCPYSGFSVGAALLGFNGEIVAASNVENAAYGSTICAERMALGAANARGLRRFQAVAVIARGREAPTTAVTAPCGACRQMLYEAAQVSGVDLEIIMSTTLKDQIVTSTISELLPMAFGPAELGVDLTPYQD